MVPGNLAYAWDAGGSTGVDIDSASVEAFQDSFVYDRWNSLISATAPAARSSEGVTHYGRSGR